MTSNMPLNDWTLIRLAEQRDTSGAVERQLLGKLEEVKLETDTLYACLETPRSSACNASFPHVLVPSRAACWHATVERSRALFKYHWYFWNVAAAVDNRSLVFPFRECLFFSSFRGTESRRAWIHSASPDQTSALFVLVTAASMCSRGSDTATQMVVEEHLVTSQLPVPFASKGFKRVHVRADQIEVHIELADRRSILEPAEP